MTTTKRIKRHWMMTLINSRKNIKKMKVNYFDHPGISSSDMSNFILAPELFIATKRGTYKRDTNPSMKNGSIKHKIILEKETFFNEYFLQSETASASQKQFIDAIINAKKKVKVLSNDELDDIHKSVYKSSSKGDGAKLYIKLADRISEEESGKQPVTPSSWWSAMAARDLLYSSKLATSKLEEAEIREQELYFRYRDLPCKAKIDGFGFITEEEGMGIIMDLKTHDTVISDEEMIRRINEEIARQLTYYKIAIENTEGYKDLAADLKGFRLFVISVDPVKVRIWEIDPLRIVLETAKINKTLDAIKEAYETSSWTKNAESWKLV